MMKRNVLQAAVNPADNDILKRAYRCHLSDLIYGSEVVQRSLDRLRRPTR